MTKIARYGVKQTTVAADQFDVLAEQIRLLGYADLDSGFDDAEMDHFSTLFAQASQTYADHAQKAGHDLDALKERDIIRILPAEHSDFWKIVFNSPLHSLLERLLGSYYILNQVNGLINRGNRQVYHQAQYHRDLPYQHFTSSQPLAINALFALDDFTLENGATRVLPSSHHSEAFPSDEVVTRIEKQIEVKRGTFIVLDCMAYHAGSTNMTAHDRRAINHVFTMPMMRQQFHFPSVLGDDMASFTQQERQILGQGLEEYRSREDMFTTLARR